MSETEEKQGVKLRSSMLTDVGVVRDHNEDSAYVDQRQRFFVVADGMGGHAAGEIASAMAVAGVVKALEEADDRLEQHAFEPNDDSRQAVAGALEGAVHEAHRSVYERGISEPDKQGMGTTLDVLLVAGQEAFVAHVGDSRTYLMRGGTAAQITADHTVAEVLVVEGRLSPEEALVSPLRTVLVNALGVGAELGVEMAHLTLHKGDRILLCSDGLHDYFPKEQELFEQVMEASPPDALRALIDAAKERGGHDNITGVIVEVLDAPEVTEGHTVPIPVMQTSSDGIPQAISKDDTMPVIAPSSDESGDEETELAVAPSAAESQDEDSESSTNGSGKQGGARRRNSERGDSHATIPMRTISKSEKPKSASGKSEDSREFSGEHTVELDADEVEDS